MSFPTIETSVDDARPVFLYRFTYTLNAWRYTNSDKSINFDNSVFVTAPVKHSAITGASDSTKASLTITLEGSSPIGEIFEIYPPSEPVIVTVFCQQYQDDVTSYAVLWKGRITGAKWVGGETLELTCESVYTSLQRPGLRRMYQLQCPFMLYGDQCGVTRDSYKEVMKVIGITSTVVTAAAAAGKPVNWYAGGYMTWFNNVNGNIEKRMIRGSDSTGAMTLSAIPVGLTGNQEINVFPGCDHTINGANGCAVKFANNLRFGGTPWSPTQNPFSGSIIY